MLLLNMAVKTFFAENVLDQESNLDALLQLTIHLKECPSLRSITHVNRLRKQEKIYL